MTGQSALKPLTSSWSSSSPSSSSPSLLESSFRAASNVAPFILKSRAKLRLKCSIRLIYESLKTRLRNLITHSWRFNDGIFQWQSSFAPFTTWNHGRKCRKGPHLCNILKNLILCRNSFRLSEQDIQSFDYRSENCKETPPLSSQMEILIEKPVIEPLTPKSD